MHNQFELYQKINIIPKIPDLISLFSWPDFQDNVTI